MELKINNPKAVIIVDDHKKVKSWLKRWKAFGLTFAIAKGVGVRAKKKGCSPAKAVSGQRKAGLRANAHKKKPRLYERQQGQCAICHCELPMEMMEIHHKLPVHYFPELSGATDNLMLLCPECHKFLHTNTLMNADLIRETAGVFGIKEPEMRWENEKGVQET